MLADAILSKDLLLAEKLLAEGADINAQDEYGESLLCEILFSLQGDPDRYRAVIFLLERGANPNLLDDERCGALTVPMICMDTEMLRLLLDHGADLNIQAGFSSDETFYDWAEFDYRYNVYELKLPEEPSESDRLDEVSWLAFLHRLAERHGVRPPDHLFLLRERGARSAAELARDA
jgi:hypothetical protein